MPFGIWKFVTRNYHSFCQMVHNKEQTNGTFPYAARLRCALYRPAQLQRSTWLGVPSHLCTQIMSLSWVVRHLTIFVSHVGKVVLSFLTNSASWSLAEQLRWNDPTAVYPIFHLNTTAINFWPITEKLMREKVLFGPVSRMGSRCPSRTKILFLSCKSSFFSPFTIRTNPASHYNLLQYLERNRCVLDGNNDSTMV